MKKKVFKIYLKHFFSKLYFLLKKGIRVRVYEKYIRNPTVNQLPNRFKDRRAHPRKFFFFPRARPQFFLNSRPPFWRPPFRTVYAFSRVDETFTESSYFSWEVFSPCWMNSDTLISEIRNQLKHPGVHGNYFVISNSHNGRRRIENLSYDIAALLEDDLLM